MQHLHHVDKFFIIIMIQYPHNNLNQKHYFDICIELYCVISPKGPLGAWQGLNMQVLQKLIHSLPKV
jgi:hypothetical protein